MDLLELPVEVLRVAEDLGDNWDRQVLTERKMRGLNRAPDSDK
jgi:hypothetical protein